MVRNSIPLPVLGDEHPETLTTAHNLAPDRYVRMASNQARTLDEDTLTHTRQVLGDDDRSTLTTVL